MINEIKLRFYKQVQKNLLSEIEDLKDLLGQVQGLGVKYSISEEIREIETRLTKVSGKIELLIINKKST